MCNVEVFNGISIHGLSNRFYLAQNKLRAYWVLFSPYPKLFAQVLIDRQLFFCQVHESEACKLYANFSAFQISKVASTPMGHSHSGRLENSLPHHSWLFCHLRGNFEICTIEAFVNVLEYVLNGRNWCTDLNINMSSVSLQKKEIVRNYILIGQAIFKNSSIITPLIIWVIVLNNSCSLLIRLWKMSFTLTIYHARGIRIIQTTGAMHHKL